MRFTTQMNNTRPRSMKMKLDFTKLLMLTTIWVATGRVEPKSWNILSNTGTTKIRMTARMIMEMPRQMAG